MVHRQRLWPRFFFRGQKNLEWNVLVKVRPDMVTSTDLLIKHFSVPFGPEPTGLQLHDHPVQLFLQGKVLPEREDGWIVTLARSFFSNEFNRLSLIPFISIIIAIPLIIASEAGPFRGMTLYCIACNSINAVLH